MHKNHITLSIAATLLVQLPGARAQCWLQTAEVPAPGGVNSGYFGKGSALQGDLALASSDESVHLFQRDLGGPGAWGQLKELLPSTPDLEGWGTAVAIDGDLIAAGHSHGSGGIGETYVFQRDQGGPDNWGQVAVLAAFDGQPNNDFGDSIALQGTTLVVSAPYATAPLGRGAIYIYEQDFGGPGAWGQIAKLVPNSVASDFFGLVALDGDTLAVAPRSGPTEIHERNQGGPNNWGLVIGVTVPDDVWSVAYSGDTLAVGNPWEDVGGVNSAGRVFLFERNQGGPNSWGQTNELEAPVSARWYGWSVALEGDRLLIGARYDDEVGSNAGAAYVYERDQGGAGAWGEVFKLVPPPPVGTDLFGDTVALDGETAMIAAVLRDAGFPDVTGLTYWPAGGVLLGTTGSKNYSLISIDPVSGAASFVGSTAPVAIFGLACDPGTGTLYGTSGTGLYTLDPNTGATSFLGQLGHSWVRGLAFDPVSGTLYGVDSMLMQLLALDTKTGAATTIGAAGNVGFQWVRGLTFDPTTATLYGTDKVTNQLVVLDTVNGEGTAVGFYGPAYNTVESLAIDTSSGALYSADLGTDEFLNVDPLTGAATSISVLGKSDTGAVIFFDHTTFENYCTAGSSASGCQALISASGVPSATNPTGFTLTTTGVEGQKNGFYVYGTGGRQANSWGSGTSFICVVPPRLRGGLQQGVGTLGQCDGVVVQDLNARWCPTCPKPAHNPGAGAVMQAQLWYRDPQNTSNQTSGFSDAIEFTFCP